MKELLTQLSSIKKSTFGKKVSSVLSYDKLILQELTFQIKSIINTEDLIVRPSVGQGVYADVPWICLLSKNSQISPSPQKGIYIVILFDKEGENFYLALSQGVTNFTNSQSNAKQRKLTIQNTVNYFSSEINKDLTIKYGFKTEKMDFGPGASKLAREYILTTVISKKYNHLSFDRNDFVVSLHVLINEYFEIIKHIGDKTYDEVLEILNPLSHELNIDSAIETIDKSLNVEYTEPRDAKIIPVLVEKGQLKSNRFIKLTNNRISKKIDHIKQAREQYHTGLIGEKLALQIERERLEKLFLDPDKYIKWCSIISDSFGYDLESVDYFDGKLSTIYIEVKSTKDILDSAFFVSKNELETSKNKGDKYRIFRLFDIASLNPKYYIANGQIEDNFYIDAVTFSAKFKYEVK